jgi:sugar lactone lactonase YvrE
MCIRLMSRLFLLTVVSGLLGLGLPATAGAAGPWKSALRIESPEKDFHLTPLRLALDRQRQRLYVVDAVAGMIIAYDSEGAEKARFNASGELREPVAMVRDRQGGIWVSDRASNQLFHIGLKSKRIERFTVRHRDGRRVVPDRLELDRDRNLLLLDRNGGRILKYDAHLNLLTEYQGPDRFIFTDFRLHQQELWALDPVRQALVIFSAAGRYLRQLDLKGLELEFPYAFAFGPENNLYLLDRHAGQIVVCDTHARLRYRFFTPGRYPGHLRYPSDLLFDWQGRLCVADEGNGRIEIMSR